MEQDTLNNNALLRDLGRNIRRARVRRSMTSEQLANSAGISRPTVRAVEQGAAGVSLGVLLQVLQALGLEKDLAALAAGDSIGRESHDIELDKVRRVRLRTHTQNLDHLIDDEWLDWYRLSPTERWKQSEALLEHYLFLGGSLDPEPDTQSPFFDEKEWRKASTHGRAGMRVIRRGGV